MPNKSLLIATLAFVAVSGFGCKSISRYVSPRVEGRVIDAETHEPIQGVKVKSITADDSYRPMDAPKGGQVLQQASPEVTGPDGQFVLNSARSLTPFRKAGWYSVTIGFQHPAYLHFSISYTLANATNSPHDEPLVVAGDVLLIPHTK